MTPNIRTLQEITYLGERMHHEGRNTGVENVLENRAILVQERQLSNAATVILWHRVCEVR